MRVLVTIICSFIFLAVYPQELDFGLLVGTDIGPGRDGHISYGPTIEYRPNNAIFSANTDLHLSYQQNELHYLIPAYIKIIFGESITVGPSIGCFFTGHETYGFVFGLSINANLFKRYVGFIRSDVYRGYMTSTTSRGDETRSPWSSYNLCIGLKYKIFD